jgi:hypothetical protein
MSAASGHRGLWTEAKYPGDAVRIQLLYRGGHGQPIELGDVRIQKYETVARVAAFTPGRCSGVFPGDTPKTEPDKYMHYRFADPADAKFDEYLQEAYQDGWQNYDPNNHGVYR